jgi:ATP-dependent Clp protease ATP-binding subunit ClpC
MRQDKFTEQAQEALSASQQLVRQLKHSQWDVEHILLALLQQEKGLVGDILNELKINTEILREKVVEALKNTPQITYEAPQIFATPRVAKLLDTAEAEANRLKDEFIGTEHLLIAISRGQRANTARWQNTDAT